MLMAKMILSSLTTSDLLNLNLNELKGLRPIILLKKALKEVSAELASKLPFMSVTYYPSNEWFCADGTTAIAVPFYLYHERLYQLEIEMMGESFEKNFIQLKKILRHEIGHAVDNAYQLRSCAIRQKLFGNSNKAYPEFYARKAFSEKFVRNLPENYAQAHPDEDFAETFAVWLDPQSQWRKKYVNKKCYQKLLYINKKMREIKNQQPLMNSKRCYDKLSSIDQSLKDFYLHKKRIYLRPERILLKDFSPRFTQKRYSHKDITLSISKRLNIPQYKTELMVKTLFKNYPLKKKSICLSSIEKHLEKRATLFLSHHFDRIPL